MCLRRESASIYTSIYAFARCLQRLTLQESSSLFKIGVLQVQLRCRKIKVNSLFGFVMIIGPFVEIVAVP